MSKKNNPIPSVEESLDNYLRSIEREKSRKTYNLNSLDDKKKLERLFYDRVDDGIYAVKENFSGSAIDLCDCGKPFVKKRFNTIMHFLPEAIDRFASKYPDLCIEEEFVKANATYNVLTYDALDHIEYLTLAAALWLLDELELRGKLPFVLPILPPDEEIDGVRLPELFEDSCFDTHLIAGIMYIIQNRNDDIKCKKPTQYKHYINEATLKRSENRHDYVNISEDPAVSCETNRQKFDFIISLIHPVVIDRVTRRFQEGEWNVFERYLKSVEPYKREEIALNEKIYSALLKQKKLLPIVTQVREQRVLNAQSMLIPNNVIANKPKIEDVFRYKPFNPVTQMSADITDEEKEFDGLMDVITLSGPRASKLKHLQDSLSYFVGSPKPSDYPPPKDMKPDDLPNTKLLEEVSVANPYETCFALLYLIDSGDSMVWLNPLGIMLMYSASHLLPWHKFTAYDEPEDDEEVDASEEPQNEGTSTDDEEEESDEENEVDDEDNTPVDWIDEEAKLYEQKYFYPKYIPSTGDYVADEKTKLNFPQFVFSETHVVIPRNAFSYLDMAEIYSIAGFDESESRLLEKYAALTDAVFVKQYSKVRRDSVEEEQEEDEESIESDNLPEPDSDEIVNLKKELQRLKEEIKRTHDEKRSLKKQAESLQQDNDRLNAELVELRSMIRSSTTIEADKTPEEHHVSFPYEATGRYVVFGGHDSWSRSIKPLLKNVRFIDSDARPNVSLILHSDAVWIQSNAIGHSDYYKILDVVRTHGIKLEYFSYASAEKCAEQLALYDLEHHQK